MDWHFPALFDSFLQFSAHKTHPLVGCMWWQPTIKIIFPTYSFNTMCKYFEPARNTATIINWWWGGNRNKGEIMMAFGIKCGMASHRVWNDQQKVNTRRESKKPRNRAILGLIFSNRRK